MRRTTRSCLLLTCLAMASPAAAQRPEDLPRPTERKPAEKPEADREPRSRRPPTNLAVQVVITRQEGERKVASLPYRLLVLTDRGATHMRMGIDTPMALSASGPLQYRTIGVNIDCGAEALEDGRFLLRLTVESNAALEDKHPEPGQLPLLRNFNATVNAALRDGQSLQTVASADPVTGEQMKVEVTLEVLK